MVKLLRTDMWLFFEYFKMIKDCIDYCYDDVSNFFSSFGCEPDDFECYVRDDMACLPYVKDFEWLYYDCDMHLPEEDRETWGELWTFTDENMIDYYKLLNELLKSGKISKAKYDMNKISMADFIHENILENQHDYGIGYTLKIAEKEGEKTCIEVEFDYNYGFSEFILYCGIILIFDRFKTKLKELRYTYCDKQELLEAA